MKLLLDEMRDHEIALQLRRRGFGVIAATESANAERDRRVHDPILFDRAQKDRLRRSSMAARARR